MPVYLAQDVIRTRQFAWIDGKATEVLRREAAEPAPPERPVVRRQPRKTTRRERRSR